MICLDEEPDVVFMQCGHAYVHGACITAANTECPLYRQHITAKITYSVLDGEA